MNGFVVHVPQFALFLLFETCHYIVLLIHIIINVASRFKPNVGKHFLTFKIAVKHCNRRLKAIRKRNIYFDSLLGGYEMF